MSSKILTWIGALFVAIILSAPESKAQVPLMEGSIQVSNKPYQPLTSYIWQYTAPYYYTYVQLNGFSFNYDTRNYTTQTMWGSGGIGFGSYGYRYPYYYGTQDYFGYSRNYPTVHAYWAMQYYQYTTRDNTMRIGILGSYPNRVVVFQWDKMNYYYGYYCTASLSYQIKLYEGSNNIEIHYGTLDRGNVNIGVNNDPYYYYHRALIGFAGYNVTSSSNWINIDPNSSSPNTGYNNWAWWVANNSGPDGHRCYSTVQWVPDFEAIQHGDCILLTYGITFEESFPEEGVSLVRESIYGNGTTDILGQGDEQKPGIRIKNSSGAASVHKWISGPVSFPVHPDYKVIYDATQIVPENTLTRFNTPTPGATSNPAFGASGNLDLTNTSAIKGGLYHSETYILDGTKEYENDYNFNIALEYDLEVNRPIDPKSKLTKKYPLTASMPVKVPFKNRGLNDIESFYALAFIYDEDGSEVWSDSLYWEAGDGDPLGFDEEITLSFRNFMPPAIGDYKFEVEAVYLGDQEDLNDTWPWKNEADMYFMVAPEIEAEALSVLVPNNESEFGGEEKYFVGRPVSPKGRFQNNGITDISDADATLTIWNLDDDEIIYTDDIVVPSIPAGRDGYNTWDDYFAEFTPPTAGAYKVCLEVNAIDDEVVNNNIVCDTFDVVDALAGTYTIGPDQNTGDSDADKEYNDRNFTTIQEAVDALYLVGVTGPVIFEFTTNSYIAGKTDLSSIEPAIDLRAEIMGVNEVNTVTFRPSAAMSNLPGNVHVHLYSASGVGVIFGQSLEVFNANAVLNNVLPSVRNNYANPSGYITFDGRTQKALKFTLHSNSVFNSAFFLSQGASNITIKNCIITSANPAICWDDFSLPVSSFVSSNFTYENNARSNGTVSYSAAVLLRSIPPQNEINLFNHNTSEILPNINSANLDTLVNKNNIVKNNDISGFAYGVVSLGIGPLIKDGLDASYYNESNEISGNLIRNMSRAGIFLGYESGTNVMRNKIYNIAGSTDYNAATDVAGIMLGGEQRSTNLGYNNMNIAIDGNEISNVGGAVNAATNQFAYGIKVEQCQNVYSSELYPTEEHTMIMNNVIWGLESGHVSTNRIGIRLMTERNTGAGAWNQILITPQVPTYFTTNDMIVNNTIMIPDDGYNTVGHTIGIAVQNANAAVVKNNAIAMLDDNGGTPSNTYAAIYYQGLNPDADMGIQSDRNVFWTTPAGTPNDQAAVYRFIQVDENSTIINTGDRNEFLSMNQWQMFAGGADFKSVLRDFTADLTTPSIMDPLSKLRINNDPSWPSGSPLNNRGEVIDEVLTDVDGNPRGMSGQRYDIGAIEFPGILLNSDIEVTTTHEPGAYRSSVATSATFSEAEYIMAEAPIEVKAELRNNGSLAQTGLEVVVQIYRQQPRANYSDPTLFYESPELEEEIITSINPSETEEVVFNLADGMGKEFYPTTYGEWYWKYVGWSMYADSMYTMPAWFSTMANNVTPLYKIVVSVRSDEDNLNNVYEKVVRFYLKRSSLNMLISVKNSAEPFMLDDDANAGRRNYDSLGAFLEGLGWKNTWKTDEVDTSMVQFYDVFDRRYWEPRAVDYSIYNVVFWSDADEDALTQREILDMKDYLAAGAPEAKKNLVIGSQELVRLNHAADPDFVEGLLSAKLDPIYPTDPLNGMGSYNAGVALPAMNITDDTKWVEGVGLGRLHRSYILRTGALPFPDNDPIPGLMTLYQGSSGLSTIAYKYNEDVVEEASPGNKETTMGVATATLSRNVILLGIDWRHYGDGDLIIRSCLDFLEKNGGDIIPVELLSFDAEAVGSRVELSWTTASEYNSARFEVERAEVNESGQSIFVKIANEEAAGKSSSELHYAVTDRGVEFNTKYVYRLKMVDLDGQYEYSDEVEVLVSGNNGITVSEPNPNPAAYNTSISFELTNDANVQIDLYDMSGKKVGVLYNSDAQTGSTTVNVDLSAYPSGVYTYVVRVGETIMKKQLHIVK